VPRQFRLGQLDAVRPAFQIKQRLARWLLISQDRARVSQFPVTQEFLGLMLSVRRAGVPRAAGQLQNVSSFSAGGVNL